jgi:hypothetical protein
MSNRWFSLLSEDFCVQMNQAAGNTETNRDHLVVTKSRAVEVVIERSELIVMSDEPELCARVTRCHVGSDVAEDVFVAKQHRAVNFRLTLPRFFIATKENLDRNILTVPNSTPNFTISSAADALG